jgi:hypothetical protein
VGVMRASTSKVTQPAYDPRNVKRETWGLAARDVDRRFAEGKGIGEYIVDQISFQASCHGILRDLTAPGRDVDALTKRINAWLCKAWGIGKADMVQIMARLGPHGYLQAFDRTTEIVMNRFRLLGQRDDDPPNLAVPPSPRGDAIWQRRDLTAAESVRDVEDWRRPSDSAYSLHDKHKVHIGAREAPNVRDDGHDFALQAVQELLQFCLVPCHADVEMVDSILHVPFLLKDDLGQ